MRQCRRSLFLRLMAPQALEAVLDRAPLDLALIADEKAGAEDGIARILRQRPSAKRIRILIGPEEGFSWPEVLQAEGVGYKPVSLGPQRRP